MTNNLSIKIYVNKIKHRITFKSKRGYYLKLLIYEIPKLLKSTEGKKAQDIDGKNVLY